MNRYETWFCGTRLWRWVTRRQVLPWVLQGSQLGEHVLELGAGPSGATEELRRLPAPVTSLQYQHALSPKLGAPVNGPQATVNPSAPLAGILTTTRTACGLTFIPPKSELQQKLPVERGRLPACGQRAKFGARLHHAQNGIARDDANDLRRAVCDATHDGHLIDIGAQKPLEQTQKRFFR